MNETTTDFKFLSVSLVGFGILTLGCLSFLGCKQKEQRPNVLLIMTDDMGYGDLGFHGNRKIDTPVLDDLATQSVRFERFMVCPYCTPTRASLMTGRYALRTGALSVTRGLETVRSEEVTIAEILKTAGYATGCFGKWHIGEHYPSHPNGQGFDDFFGIPQGHINQYYDPQLDHNGNLVDTKGYVTDILTDSVLQFIERHQSEPFFCYVPYNAPHSPFQVPDRYFDKYIARDLDARTATIYGMVENMDENIGRLLSKLDELALADRTIVIFLSDNGPEGQEGSRYNAGMRGMKGTVHEGGTRVPMFVRWPGRFIPGNVKDNLAAHIDLLPTIAELCGITCLETFPLDGVSLVPLLNNSKASWPNRMLFDYSAGWRRMVEFKDSVISHIQEHDGTVRTQRWRAVNEGDGWQLYDMHNDPLETQDVAANYPDTVSYLSAAYENWFTDVTKIPIARPHIQIGHLERPLVELPAPEAYFTEGISWYNKWGFAHDWLTGWSSPDDRIWWNIDVAETGNYEVSIAYTCLPEAVGTNLRVEAGESFVEGNINRAYNPELRLRPSRINDNWYVETFERIPLGKIHLEQGRHRITIRALVDVDNEIPICDLKSLLLHRENETFLINNP